MNSLRFYISGILFTILLNACSESKKEDLVIEKLPSLPPIANESASDKAIRSNTDLKTSDLTVQEKIKPKKLISKVIGPIDPCPMPSPEPDPWPDPYPPGYWEPIDPPMPVEPEPIAPVEPFVAEDEAMFPGGTAAMMKFITENIKISDTDLEMGCMGKVYVRIVVEIDGKITHPEVLKGISGCPGLSKSALDVIKMMPDWIPAQIRGKAVACYVNLPVTIKYQ
jgi:outer membrane biosynthesis protein TonB